MREKQRPLNCLLVLLAKRNQQDLAIFLIVFNKTIIPLALVGYEMIIGPRWQSIISYPARARGIIVKYSFLFKFNHSASTLAVTGRH